MNKRVNEVRGEIIVFRSRKKTLHTYFDEEVLGGFLLRQYDFSMFFCAEEA